MASDVAAVRSFLGLSHEVEQSHSRPSAATDGRGGLPCCETPWMGLWRVLNGIAPPRDAD